MGIVLKTVGVVVKDMAKTLDFYRMLGVSAPAGAEKEQNVEAGTGSGVVLGFLTEEVARAADPGFVTPVGQSLNLQFECGTPAEVDATFQALTGAGHAAYAEPWDAFWGQRFARVADPDGRIFNLYADL